MPLTPIIKSDSLKITIRLFFKQFHNYLKSQTLIRLVRVVETNLLLLLYYFYK